MRLKSAFIAFFAAFAALSTQIAPAAAEEFTILIYETKADLASRTDAKRSQAYWESYNRFAAVLAQAGVLRGGTALSETQSRTIDARGVRDAARELRGTRTGGYFVIDVASLDEAVRWARQAPGATSGAVEVRPHRANPTAPMSGGPPSMAPKP